MNFMSLVRTFWEATGEFGEMAQWPVMEGFLCSQRLSVFFKKSPSAERGPVQIDET